MIEVRELSKVYGNRVAVWKADFQVAKGEILGFLGPNGAGKTTTMRMITGFIPPSGGTAVIDGHDVTKTPLEVKSRIGYLCEMPPVYREMSVTGYLKFVAEIKRVPANKRKPWIDRAVELCGLTDVSGRIIGHLSKGYRQRVGLAQAVLHQPTVLILDEPTVGLDPAQIPEIRRLIRELSGDQTVILSTHILPEVTKTCDRVVIINEGQIVAQDSIDNLTAESSGVQTVQVRVARDDAGLQERFEALDGVIGVFPGGEGEYTVRLADGDVSRERLAESVVASGAGLVGLSRRTATLEEVFLKLVTDESDAGAAA